MVDILKTYYIKMIEGETLPSTKEDILSYVDGKIYLNGNQLYVAETPQAVALSEIIEEQNRLINLGL